MEEYYFEAGKNVIIAGAVTLTLLHALVGLLAAILVAGILSVALKILRRNSEEHMRISGRGVGFEISRSALSVIIVLSGALIGLSYGGLKYVDIVLNCFPNRFP